MSNEQNERAALPPPYRKQGQQMSADGVQVAHCDLWCREQVEDAIRAALASKQVPDAKAWAHEGDPSRVISDAQKQQALRDGGASASSVKPYSVALASRQPLDTAGNRHPEYRYAGYKDEPLQPGSTPDQGAAWLEGRSAAQPQVGQSGHEVIEAALARASKGDPNDAPFPMGSEQGKAYVQGLAAAYLHALEMIPAQPPAPPQAGQSEPCAFAIQAWHAIAEARTRLTTTKDPAAVNAPIALNRVGDPWAAQPPAAPQEFSGELAYQLTKRLVVDLATARAAVDAAMLSCAAQPQAGELTDQYGRPVSLERMDALVAALDLPPQPEAVKRRPERHYEEQPDGAITAVEPPAAQALLPLTDEQRAELAEDWATDRIADVDGLVAEVERMLGIGTAKPAQPEGCEARQHSDQMVCKRCDLGWDMNDPEPPRCPK